MLTVLSMGVAIGCAHGTGSPSRLSDGGYALSCKGPLSDCLHHAERLCRDEGYTVAEARDVRELYGHESGQSQVLVETSNATVYCGSHTTRPAISLKRDPDPVVTAPPATALPPKPTPVCVAGATQACVGSAGCPGGQTCSLDGSKFEACDCGTK
jgi:hypothetical protein